MVLNVKKKYSKLKMENIYNIPIINLMFGYPDEKEYYNKEDLKNYGHEAFKKYMEEKRKFRIIKDKIVKNINEDNEDNKH